MQLCFFVKTEIDVNFKNENRIHEFESYTIETIKFYEFIKLLFNIKIIKLFEYLKNFYNFSCKNSVNDNNNNNALLKY